MQRKLVNVYRIQGLFLWGLDVMTDLVDFSVQYIHYFYEGQYTNLLRNYHASSLSAHVPTVVSCALRKLISQFTHLELSLPVTSSFQYGLMCSLSAVQEEVSFCCWTRVFDQWSREMLWATLHILKCSQHREARQRPGFCCHHLRSALIWN